MTGIRVIYMISQYIIVDTFNGMVLDREDTPFSCGFHRIIGSRRGWRETVQL